MDKGPEKNLDSVNVLKNISGGLDLEKASQALGGTFDGINTASPLKNKIAPGVVESLNLGNTSFLPEIFGPQITLSDLIKNSKDLGKVEHAGEQILKAGGTNTEHQMSEQSIPVPTIGSTKSQATNESGHSL